MLDNFDSIVVDAPARLHFGFVDLHGGGGRRFGSLGVALDELSTRVRAVRARSFSAAGEDAARAQRHMLKLRKQYKFQHPIAVTVERCIPPHSGLGSGTQLALAIGTAMARSSGMNTTAREIAELLDRGNRSGIGLGAFEYGGLLVDGGRGALAGAPPLISRLHFPEDWRIVLLFDSDAQGLHGINEARAFRELAPFSEAQAQHLAHVVLMQALPAVAEKDLKSFGAAVSYMQAVVGDYFAPAQGGRYTSARIASILTWMQSEGVNCVGQTSWGPTGFAIVESEDTAKGLLKSAARRLRAAGVEPKICRARNRGGSIEMVKAAETN